MITREHGESDVRRWARRRNALTGRQPGGQILDTTERAGRLGERGEPVPGLAFGGPVRRRDDYFEVNYGDGLVPLDKLFGTWHDGSPEAEARMNARYEKRKARLNAVKTAS